MSKKILFLVNGLGLGNSIRCFSIIQRLRNYEAEVNVVCSGNSAWFFKDKINKENFFEVDQIQYGKKGNNLSIYNTLLLTKNNLKIIKENVKKISKIIDNLKPNIIVTDSVYLQKKIKKFQIPIVAINNSDFTKSLFFRYKNKPISILAQFYCVEYLDYLYHQSVPDLVISPTLFEKYHKKNILKNNSKIIRVGPIFREDLKHIKSKDSNSSCLFMLSGSVFSTKVDFRKINDRIIINVINKNLDNNFKQNNVNFYTKVKNNIELINNAQFAVINAGFSAISELFYLKKPMIIMPIANHAEQWTNAKHVEENNIGIIANENNYEKKMFDIIENIDFYKENYQKIILNNDGASDSAEIILTFNK